MADKKYKIAYTGPDTDEALAMARRLVDGVDSIPVIVSDWLSKNISPTSPAVDASLSVSGAAADAAVTGDLKSKSMYYRGNIAAGTDMDTLIQPGFWKKDAGVSVVNGVGSTARARIVVFGENSQWALAQLWFNTVSNIVYIRTRTSASLAWNAWARLGEYPEASMTVQLDRMHLSSSQNGAWTGVIADLGKGVGTMLRYSAPGAKTLAVKWTPKNKKTVDGSEQYCDIIYLFEYDENGDLVHYSTQDSGAGVDTDGTKTMKVTLNAATVSFAVSVYNNSTVNALPNRAVLVTAYGAYAITKEKNARFAPNIDGSRWRRFGYVVGNSGDSIEDEVYNTGMIMFPPNYSKDGKPVPVIVMVHGSAAYTSILGTENPDYEEYYNYLADCGYALVDCYGWTSKYPEGSGLHNPWIMPTTAKAYLEMLHIVFEAFNLDQNNVFIMCKSLGGHMCSWLGGKINAKAVGMLAPAINLNFGYSDSNYRVVLSNDLGLEGVADATLGWATAEACMSDFIANYRSWSYEKRRAFYLANEDKIMGWSGEFLNLTGMTASEMLTYSAAKSMSQTGLCKTGYPPTKIWFAMDDESISPTMCSTFVQQIRNGGGFGAARVMPSGTGGHHAVDTDANALQQTDVTTPLGVTYASVPLAYYELWEFFNRYTTGSNL